MIRPNALFASILSYYRPAWWTCNRGSFVAKKYCPPNVKVKLSRAVKSCGVKVKVKVKVEVKVLTVHAMEAYTVSRGTSPHILTPALDGGECYLHASAALFPRNNAISH